MLVGSILTVVLAAASTLYVQTYVAYDAPGTFEVSQLVWAFFLVLNVDPHLCRRAKACANCWSVAGAKASG